MRSPIDGPEWRFDQMWKDAEADFRKRTQKALKYSSTESLDDVLKKLETKFSAPESDDDSPSSGRKKKMKEVFSNVLNFVNLLGGLAAEGASIVFGPATMCFNAVQILIEMPWKLNKFYDELAQLFEEIAGFMKQFKIYQRIEQYAEVEMELKQGTHKLLITFVETLALSIEIMGGSKWKTFRTQAKVILFDNDSGVSAKLEEFRRQVENQSRISDAVTLERVFSAEKNISDSVHEVYKKLTAMSEQSKKEFSAKLDGIQTDVGNTSRGVNLLVSESTERTAEKLNREQIDKICYKLSLKREAVKVHLQEMAKARQESIEGTGIWLEDVPLYTAWANLDTNVDPMLIISGANGSGKTHLLYSMAQKLRSNDNALPSQTRTVLGMYSFSGRNSNTTNNEMESSPAVTALKHLAVQIAEQDVKFAKDLLARVEKKESSSIKRMDCKDICKLVDFTSPAKDLYYVLLFDGLDKLILEEAKQLFNALFRTRAGQTRVVISGTPEILESCLSTHGFDLGAGLVLHNEEYNDRDIRAFIESELKRRTTFNGDVIEITELNDVIREKLPQVGRGNFIGVQWVFDSIEDAIDSDQPLDEIERAYLDPNTIVDLSRLGARLVDDLQDQLSSAQIEQLNIILIWTSYGFVGFQPVDIQAVLYLHTGRETLQLEKKIRDKYGKALLINRFGYVQAKSELEDFLRLSLRADDSKMSSDDEPRISMTIELKDVKMSLARRFFWDLSERAVFGDKPFRYDQLAEKVGPKLGTGVTPVEGHLAITRHIFDILSQESTKHTKELICYALGWLPRHLSFLLTFGDGNLREKERNEIGHSLVDLLRDTDWIDRHWIECTYMHNLWLENKPYAYNIFWEWLTDPKAMSGLKRKEQRWVENITSDDSRKERVIESITSAISQKWLCYRDWGNCAEDIYHWIDTILDLQESQDSQSSDEEKESLPNQGDEQQKLSTVDRVQRAVSVAEENIALSGKPAEKNSLWFERVGAVYWLVACDDAAIETLLKAKSLPECDWRVAQTLAVAYESQEKLELAIQEMQVAQEMIKAKSDPDDLKDAAYRSNMRSIALWQGELGLFDDAIKQNYEILSLDPCDPLVCYRLFNLLREADRGAEVIEMLTKMSQESSQLFPTLTKLQEILLGFAAFDEDPSAPSAFQMVLLTCINQPVFETLLDTLRTTLDYARKEDHMSSVAVLSFSLGEAIAFQDPFGIHSNESAIIEWKECCKIAYSINSWTLEPVLIEALTHVISYHHAQASQAKQSNEDIKHFITELERIEQTIARGSSYDLKLNRHSLAKCYHDFDHPERARNLLLDDVKTAFDILSDDDPDNDLGGYARLASVFIRIGDDLGALTASSPTTYAKLPGEVPNTNGDKSEENNTIELPQTWCDGKCGKVWTQAYDAWACKLCPNAAFCVKCIEKLRNGTLNQIRCSPHHEHLHLPPESDESFIGVGPGQVRIEGELVDGKRIGGRVVPVAEWLDMVRADWGIEKPSPPEDKSTVNSDAAREVSQKP